MFHCAYHLHRANIRKHDVNLLRVDDVIKYNVLYTTKGFYFWCVNVQRMRSDSILMSY